MFTLRSTAQGIKYRPDSIRKFNNSKFELGGSEKFQKWHLKTVECLNILNVMNIKVAEFIKYQRHGVSNYILSVKSIKIEKEKGACHIKLF